VTGANPSSKSRARRSDPDAHLSLREDAPPLPAEVREVADELVGALGDELRALLWHGSFARGEAKPDSDHDLIIVLKRIDDDLLLRLRDVFRGRANWSTFVQSEEEVRQFPPDGRVQFHFGLVPLYGDFELPPWTRENILADLRSLARNIRFEGRYRLLHRGPEFAEEDQNYRRFVRAHSLRMLRDAVKLAVLALKAREVLHGRSYPVTRAEIRARLTDPDELAVLDIVERWSDLRPKYEADITPLALQLDAFARRLVAQLPKESS
jgi:predicted nucleotidyltransferase